MAIHVQSSPQNRRQRCSSESAQPVENANLDTLPLPTRLQATLALDRLHKALSGGVSDARRASNHARRDTLTQPHPRPNQHRHSAYRTIGESADVSAVFVFLLR